MKYNFIKTQDVETANNLKKMGFELLSEDNGTYTFLNNSKLMFSNKDNKAVYTNSLTF